MSAPSIDPQIAIRVRGLCTSFGPQVVHKDLDLDVRAGEILGVIGPSGCGKSVLLRQIVGLERPQAGRIDVLGVDILNATHVQHALLERRWGVMFQDGALFSTLSLRENVEAPMRETRLFSPAFMRELADLRLHMAGLTAESFDKKPSEISGGMRKRAALARALSLDPELLFLDEPTAGLDPVTAGRFDALLKELARAMNLTVFLVTHDLDTLHAVCDRICVLHGAKVAALGTLEDVRASAHPWIQDYFSGPRGRAAAAGL